jgi:hypothetical protein
MPTTRENRWTDIRNGLPPDLVAAGLATARLPVLLAIAFAEADGRNRLRASLGNAFSPRLVLAFTNAEAGKEHARFKCYGEHVRLTVIPRVATTSRWQVSISSDLGLASSPAGGEANMSRAQVVENARQKV